MSCAGTPWLRGGSWASLDGRVGGHSELLDLAPRLGREWGPTASRAEALSRGLLSGTREGMEVALLGPCCSTLLLPSLEEEGAGPEERGAEDLRGVFTRQGAGAEITGAEGDRFTPPAEPCDVWWASIFLGGELRERGLLRRTVSQPSESSRSTAMGSREALLVRMPPSSSAALGPFTLSAQLRPLELRLRDSVDPLLPSSLGFGGASVVVRAGAADLCEAEASDGVFEDAEGPRLGTDAFGGCAALFGLATDVVTPVVRIPAVVPCWAACPPFSEELYVIGLCCSALDFDLASIAVGRDSLVPLGVDSLEAKGVCVVEAVTGEVLTGLVPSWPTVTLEGVFTGSFTDPFVISGGGAALACVVEPRSSDALFSDPVLSVVSRTTSQDGTAAVRGTGTQTTLFEMSALGPGCFSTVSGHA